MSRFFWVGNRVAVDFTNIDGVADGAPLDLPGTAAELRAWLVQAGLFSGERSGAGLIEAARRYRIELRAGMMKLAAGKPIPLRLLEQTNAYLGRGREASRRPALC